MRHFFRRHLPNHQTIREYSWLRPFAGFLQHPNLWHLNRNSVSGGVAIGLFCGLIPGPLQMLSAAICAVLFRANLPVAMFITLYTNPFTILPLYVLAYEIGVLVLNGAPLTTLPVFPELSWHHGLQELSNWLLTFGRPLLVGLPLFGLGLAVLGYFGVRLAWRITVQLRWRQRQKTRLKKIV